MQQTTSILRSVLPTHLLFPPTPGNVIAFIHMQAPWHYGFSLSKPSDQVINSLSPSFVKAPDVTKMKVNARKPLLGGLAQWLIRAIPWPSRSSHFSSLQLSFFFSSQSPQIVHSYQPPTLPWLLTFLSMTHDEHLTTLPSSHSLTMESLTSFISSSTAYLHMLGSW